MGAGRSADGAGGECECVGEEEKVVCVSAGEGRGEGAAAGNPMGGCWGPPESATRGSGDGSELRSRRCCAW